MSRVIPAICSVSMLAIWACRVENGFSNKPDVNTGEDSADSVPPETDSTPVLDEGCPEQSWDPEYIGIDESCQLAPVVGTFTPVVEWRNNTIGDAYTTPVVGRIYDQNGDDLVDESDVPAVIVATTSGNLVAMAGGDGTVLWTVGGLGSEPMTPALGDLNGDGRPEVVASGVSQTIAVRGNGSTYWTSSGVSNGFCGAVGIGDLDADGAPEVLLGALILEGTTGSRKGMGAYGSGTGYSGGWAAAMGVAADINQDGLQEAVVGNALYDAHGNALWYNGSSDGFVAVGNFDDDPYGEIVVTGLGYVRLQDDDGTILWNGSYTGSTTGPPTIADFDGDGGPEIGVAGMGMYMVIDADGTRLWSRTTFDSSSGFTGSAVFDFEGDGAAEVVYADEQNLYVFDGATGTIKLQEDEHSSATCSEYPSIADVDNDGHAEIIYTSSAYTGSESGVRVVGDLDNSWMSGRPVWNQHAYSITNVEDDVGIPATPETNWVAGYNSFRSGDITPVSGSGLADIEVQILDVCEEDCSAGALTVWIAAENAGTMDLTESFNIEIFAETDAGAVSVYTLPWTEPIPSGYRSASVELSLSGIPTPIYGLVAIANADGAVTECHTDNNKDTFDELLCGG